MHKYEVKSFSPEQEQRLRNSAGPSCSINDFLTVDEFDLCRKITLGPIAWPEHGTVSKYWGFGWDNGAGKLLHWLKPKIDAVLPNWELDFLAVQEAIDPWKLHADIRWYADKIPYKVMLMPMDVEPVTGPVDVNSWPDTYTIAFKQRNFLSQYNREFEDLEKFTGNRQDTWVRPIDDRKIEGCIPGNHVTQEEYKKYFSHMPYEHLEGLTIDGLYKWQPRSLFHWDNTAVHCADNFLANNIKTKRCLMIFSTLK